MNTFLHPPGWVGVIPSHSRESLSDMREDIQAVVMWLIAWGLLIPNEEITKFISSKYRRWVLSWSIYLSIYLAFRTYLEEQWELWSNGKTYISQIWEKISSHEFTERYLTSGYQNEVNTDKKDKMLTERARELGFLCLTDVATLFCRRVDAMLSGVL